MSAEERCCGGPRHGFRLPREWRGVSPCTNLGHRGSSGPPPEDQRHPQPGPVSRVKDPAGVGAGGHGRWGETRYVYPYHQHVDLCLVLAHLRDSLSRGWVRSGTRGELVSRRRPLVGGTGAAPEKRSDVGNEALLDLGHQIVKGHRPHVAVEDFDLDRAEVPGRLDCLAEAAQLDHAVAHEPAAHERVG